MQVFGQPASSNLTVSSSPTTINAGRQYAAGPPLSYLQSAQVPHADARWAMSVTVGNNESTKPQM